MLIVSKTGLLICLIIYISTAIIGFLIYEEKLHDSVLDCLNEDIFKHINSDPFIIVNIFLINIAFLVIIIVSIPMIFFPLKKIAFSIIEDYLNFKLENNSNEDNKLTMIMNNNENKIELSKEMKDKITIGIYFAILFVTMTVRFLLSV